MSFDLEKHLHEEHNRSPLSIYLKEIVYGGNDGIITTFAVVAGFAGAQLNNAGNLPYLVVLLFGFANLSADGISMALGNFLSTRSEQDVYRNEKRRELREIRSNPDGEKEESVTILKNKGFTQSQARTLVDIYATNEPYWLDFMMDKELTLPNPEGDNPFLMSFVTFFSFICFGLIPLLPYLFLAHTENIFPYSIFSTLSALIILGILRWRVSHHSWMRSIGETLLLGGAAATVAYLVGVLFRI